MLLGVVLPPSRVLLLVTIFLNRHLAQSKGTVLDCEIKFVVSDSETPTVAPPDYFETTKNEAKAGEPLLFYIRIFLDGFRFYSMDVSHRWS